MTALFILVFSICGASYACEDGFVMARDCPSAEAWVRQALKPDQSLFVLSCEPYGGRWPG